MNLRSRKREAAQYASRSRRSQSLINQTTELTLSAQHFLGLTAFLFCDSGKHPKEGDQRNSWNQAGWGVQTQEKEIDFESAGRVLENLFLVLSCWRTLSKCVEEDV